MKNPEIGHFNTEPTSEQPLLSRNDILLRLARLNRELGWGLEEDVISDLEGDNPDDDNDFLGNLASLAYEHDIDHEEFFQLLGVEME